MPTTAQMLENLPTLAAEAFLTIDAPNPTNRPARGVRQAHSRPPANLDAIDCLRVADPDAWGHGHLWELAQCSRVALDAVAENGDVDQLPPLPRPTTWVGECGWLLATRAHWESCADEADIAFIDDTVATIWRDLRRLVRAPRPLRVSCVRVLGTMRCGGRIMGRDQENRDTADLARSAWCYCVHCGQTYTYDAEIKRLGQLQRLPLSAWAAEFGVPVETLRKRVNRLGLKPDATDRNGRKLYDRESVSRLREAVG